MTQPAAGGLTDRNHVMVRASTGTAEGAGGAGHHRRVALTGFVHHLRQKEALQVRSRPRSET